MRTHAPGSQVPPIADRKHGRHAPSQGWCELLLLPLVVGPRCRTNCSGQLESQSYAHKHVRPGLLLGSNSCALAPTLCGTNSGDCTTSGTTSVYMDHSLSSFHLKSFASQIGLIGVVY